MGARQKLNQAFFVGSVITAGLLGLLTASWVVFLVALGILVGSNLYLGEIRSKRRQ